LIDMPTVVNVYEAKTQLSRLIEMVERGDDVVIARAGRPVVRMVPYAQVHKEPRQLGLMAGQIWMAPDFDEYDQEIIKMFEGDGADVDRRGDAA
jgi:prevent-host-death family protein